MKHEHVIAKLLKGKAISKEALAAAQAAYEGNPEYGLNDADMKSAIAAAVAVMVKKGTA